MAWTYDGRVLLTVREMLADRGFGEDIEEADGDIPDTQHMLRCRGPSGLAVVLAGTKPRVGVRVLRAIAREKESEGIALAILILQEGLTPFAKTELAADPQCGIEIFTGGELGFNVTQCQLVPPHTAVDDAAWAAIVAETPTLTPDCLMSILTTDPVVRYYGWPPGTVVRVDRNMGGQQVFPVYRRVVRALK